MMRVRSTYADSKTPNAKVSHTSILNDQQMKSKKQYSELLIRYFDNILQKKEFLLVYQELGFHP